MEATTPEPPPNSELYFALIGAIGSNIKKVGDELGQELRRMGYTVNLIRLSDLAWDIVQPHARFSKLGPKPDEGEDGRLNRLMDVGNTFREVVGEGYAMILPAIAKIRNVRSHGIKRLHEGKNAFILHSIKHQKEIELLRGIYRDKFFAVSVYAPYASRVASLAKKISQSRGSYDIDESRKHACQLVERDAAEDGKRFGQNVRECFPLADLFVDQSDEGGTSSQIKRFVEILFGHQFQTPTKSEMGMFFAQAASFRSADLSRQVGAVIVGDHGEVLATGCNEVPAGGGDSHWPDESGATDNRDFTKGYDTTARVKIEMLTEVFSKLRDKGLLMTVNESDEQLATKALAGAGAMLSGTRAASIIEFGRAVHAEMSAISQAARLGIAVGGRVMYATTFPCHMCARHIIATGINQVVYVEPYPKSMTQELYPDDVAIDGPSGSEVGDGRVRVRFTPFMGIAPRRFMELFRGEERKDQLGWAREWSAEIAS